MSLRGRIKVGLFNYLAETIWLRLSPLFYGAVKRRRVDFASFLAIKICSGKFVETFGTWTFFLFLFTRWGERRGCSWGEARGGVGGWWRGYCNFYCACLVWSNLKRKVPVLDRAEPSLLSVSPGSVGPSAGRGDSSAVVRLGYRLAPPSGESGSLAAS